MSVVHTPAGTGVRSRTGLVPVVFTTRAPANEADRVLDEPLAIHHFPSQTLLARFVYQDWTIATQDTRYCHMVHKLKGGGKLRLGGEASMYFVQCVPANDVKFVPASIEAAQAILENVRFPTRPALIAHGFYPPKHHHLTDYCREVGEACERDAFRANPIGPGPAPLRDHGPANANADAIPPPAKITTPSKRVSNLVSRAAGAGIQVELAALAALEQIVAEPCAYCGRAVEDGGSHGHERLVPTGPYCLANVVSACKTCNFVRGRMAHGTFRDLAARIAAMWGLNAGLTLPPPRSNLGAGGVSTVLVDKNEDERKARTAELRDREALGLASCYLCGRGPEDTKEGRLGVDRKYNNHGYSVRNSHDCCWECNKAKKDYPFEPFVAHMVRIHRHLSHPATWAALAQRVADAHRQIEAGAFADLPVPVRSPGCPILKSYVEKRDGIAVIDTRVAGYVAAAPFMSALAADLEVDPKYLRHTTKVAGGRTVGYFRLVRVSSHFAWKLQTGLQVDWQRDVIARVRHFWHRADRAVFMGSQEAEE